jgi:hypothetical protein
MYCSSCHQPCSAIERDIGIGTYEFGGTKGYESTIVMVSDCCGAGIDQDQPLSKDEDLKP